MNYLLPLSVKTLEPIIFPTWSASSRMEFASSLSSVEYSRMTTNQYFVSFADFRAISKKRV